MLTRLLGRFALLLVLVPAWCASAPAATPTPAAAAAAATASAPDEGDAPFTFNTFRNIAKKQMPCVVSIATDLVLEEPQEDFPLFRFYRDAPNHPEQHSKGTGSGVIITPDGLVLTNNHVIESSKSVQVVLLDGTNLEAKIIGTDPQLDIALLKVEPEHPLQTGTLGDSDVVQIGDWVLAIGSPYGLSHSVSAGIISALGRDIQSGAYDSFMQTDAAINRGNSGGPLFNIRGEVVGINTAILSSSGGSNGIGFAIPINQVKDILDDLEKHGTVTRGWLGVGIRDVTKQDQTDLGLKSLAGSLVTDIWDGSPALKAGLQQNDVVVRFAGADVTNTKALLLAVAKAKIGSVLPMDVLRKGETVHLQVEISARPDELDMSAHSLNPESVVRPQGLGMTFQAVDDAARTKYKLQADDGGFVITEVQPKGVAETAGLESGDLLLEINRNRISTAEELLKALKGQKTVLFLVRRGPKSLFFSIDASALEGDPDIKQD